MASSESPQPELVSKKNSSSAVWTYFGFSTNEDGSVQNKNRQFADFVECQFPRSGETPPIYSATCDLITLKNIVAARNRQEEVQRANRLANQVFQMHWLL